jgi:hypothetical protein
MVISRRSFNHSQTHNSIANSTLLPNPCLTISRSPCSRIPMRDQTCANDNNVQHTRGTGLQSIEISHTVAWPVSLESVKVAVVQIHFQMVAPSVAVHKKNNNT